MNTCGCGSKKDVWCALLHFLFCEIVCVVVTKVGILMLRQITTGPAYSCHTRTRSHRHARTHTDADIHMDTCMASSSSQREKGS